MMVSDQDKPSGSQPVFVHKLSEAVDYIIKHAGPDLRLAMPLGIGKPNLFANLLYQRVKSDRALQLDIFTALSLLKPRAGSELENRFLQPLTERLFGNYPDLDYALDMQSKKLPTNIRVHEFFLKSGDWLSNSHAQQHYISSNYTHIARDMAAKFPNIVAQAVAVRQDRGRLRFSLSCNPDVTLDLVTLLRQQQCKNKKSILVAVVNHELPFMSGSAEVPSEFFDLVVDDPQATHDLFCTPNMKVTTADYAIGLHASSLVRDGGTLQIGIGSLGDAIARSLIVRHKDNADYQKLLRAINYESFPDYLCKDTFAEGLYGCSEMLVNGLLELFKEGIISRAVEEREVGRRTALHGGFFIGPNSFYRSLREMPAAKLDLINMSSITFINQLYGDAFADESTKRAQRVKASFINTCMMVTLSGAAVSDGLSDGRVVSGVGGQYNFVAMAHELPDARSILMLRSWRMHDGKPQSNIVANYGHCTIPRHLRDIVITEYGIADLRGKSDEEVIVALLAITDARFQQSLCDWAKEQGKLAQDFELPDVYARNTPEQLDMCLQPFRQSLPDYPFGHDFTDDELVIIAALQKLKQSANHPVELLKTLVAAVFSDKEVPARYLERMGLDEAHSMQEKILQKLFSGNL